MKINTPPVKIHKDKTQKQPYIQAHIDNFIKDLQFRIAIIQKTQKRIQKIHIIIFIENTQYSCTFEHEYA